MTVEGELLWRPSQDFASGSNLAQYMEWLRPRGHDFTDYPALWRWSVDEPDAFWASLWDYFQIWSDRPYEEVCTKGAMIDARWFTGSRVNYAEHVLRNLDSRGGDAVAIHYRSEMRPGGTVSWQELEEKVRRLATAMRDLGVVPGDRVVSYMPNIPETAIAMLATVAIGAIWSSAAPEFGVGTVTDRFAQIEPKLIFAADGYRFAGRDFDRRADIAAIVGKLPTLEHLVWLDYAHPSGAPVAHRGLRKWDDLVAGDAPPREQFRYERVPHDHPLWILFSSGTTGLPKPIVQGHVGVLIQHMKGMSFHVNIRPGTVLFIYSTTGWMMWNSTMSALCVGGGTVLYDGSPFADGVGTLFAVAQDTGAHVLGASPTLVQAAAKAGFRPRDHFALDALEEIILGGAPSTPETFAWFYDAVKTDLWVTSQCGGTELCSGIVGGVPIQPIYAGEIQGPMLGIDVAAFDDQGRPVIDEVGEMVITKPVPSMPLYFWNDPDKSRYRASYFETFPEVWQQGDLFKMNDRLGCYVYGRSDATLNRFGVRIGTAEIYRTLEKVEGVQDGLVLCCNLAGGDYYMPLFVKLKEGVAPDDAVRAAIIRRLRDENSPRHVPDEILFVPDIPYTMTGKRLEIPVRKILLGAEAAKVASRETMANPASLDWFTDFAACKGLVGL
ncbi:acetoacetate--CoA ligase [Sphingobium sp. EM0848]|uniref:acetoacetate--CoA ligase n=1 Tax=Sphingobium sp. EM0848 TaxID=2743473 RepID=UPI00159C7A48|nr:acetoacetate--CoA ligase [Sphingobium sp. EM0848]